MEVELPADCGNAPRITIVGDFAVNWAKGNTDAVSELFAVEANWTLIGAGTFTGPEAAQKVRPALSPDLVTVTSIVTHGRLASCDGFMSAGGRRRFQSRSSVRQHL